MRDEEYAEVDRLLREAETRTTEEKVRNMQQDVIMQQQDKSMIAEQLDLGDELDRIDYLLRGYTLERNEQTKESEWVKPDDNDMIILSDYGVHLIRNTIAWYLNKNTLLSNYDEDTINHKMEDFASDLNDTIFMEYEKVFQYPTLDDCKKVLNDRLSKKKELKIYSLELIGIKVDEKKIKDIQDQVFKEIQPIIERELQKIKEQTIKNKLKRFMIIIREVQDAVHSTYLRAWKGQERTTLRQHIHISETKGGMVIPQQSRGFSPVDFFKRSK